MRLFLSRFPTRQLPGGPLFALPGVATVDIVTANAATLIATSTADSRAGSLRDTITAAGDGDTIQSDPAPTSIMKLASRYLA